MYSIVLQRLCQTFPANYLRNCNLTLHILIKCIYTYIKSNLVVPMLHITSNGLNAYSHPLVSKEKETFHSLFGHMFVCLFSSLFGHMFILFLHYLVTCLSFFFIIWSHVCLCLFSSLFGHMFVFLYCYKRQRQTIFK
jgi:hypothetical protein